MAGGGGELGDLWAEDGGHFAVKALGALGEGLVLEVEDKVLYLEILMLDIKYIQDKEELVVLRA